MLFFVQIAGKRDAGREAEAQKWIEEVTNSKFSGPFDDCIRDGQV